MVTTLGFSVRAELAHHHQGQPPKICLSGYFSYNFLRPEYKHTWAFGRWKDQRSKKERVQARVQSTFSGQYRKVQYETWNLRLYFSFHRFFLWNNHGFRAGKSILTEDRTGADARHGSDSARPQKSCLGVSVCRRSLVSSKRHIFLSHLSRFLDWYITEI